MLKSNRNWPFLLLIGMSIGVFALIILSPPQKKSAQVTFTTAKFNTNGHMQISYRSKQSSGTFLRHGKSGSGCYSWLGLPSSGASSTREGMWHPNQIEGLDPEVLKLTVTEGQTYTINLGETLTLYDFTDAQGIKQRDELSLEPWKPQNRWRPQKDASENLVLP